MSGNGLILVSGLARCGTSLLMQMLSAGGWPVFEAAEAPWPGFENHRAMADAPLPSDASGMIKWLDPQRFAPPPRVRGSIFLTRDTKQQAKSFVKFGAVFGLRGSWQRLAASLVRDEPLAREALVRSGPILEVTFEDLVTEPLTVVGRISTFIGEPLGFGAAASQLRKRPTGAACLPYLLETQMVHEVDREDSADNHRGEEGYGP